MSVKVTVSGGLRYRICPDCGDAHDKYAWPDNHRRPDEVLQAPMVIRDGMDLTEHVDGKFYDSKRGYRKTTRQLGYVEVGNDPQRKKPKQKPKPDRKAIHEAVEKARARYSNGERIRPDRPDRQPA